jgi:hypothetical protein
LVKGLAPRVVSLHFSAANTKSTQIGLGIPSKLGYLIRGIARKGKMILREDEWILWRRKMIKEGYTLLYRSGLD